MKRLQLDCYCLCEMIIAVKMKLFLIPLYYLGIWKKPNGSNRNKASWEQQCYDLKREGQWGRKWWHSRFGWWSHHVRLYANDGVVLCFFPLWGISRHRTDSSMFLHFLFRSWQMHSQHFNIQDTEPITTITGYKFSVMNYAWERSPSQERQSCYLLMHKQKAHFKHSIHRLSHTHTYTYMKLQLKKKIQQMIPMSKRIWKSPASSSRSKTCRFRLIGNSCPTPCQ